MEKEEPELLYFYQKKGVTNSTPHQESHIRLCKKDPDFESKALRVVGTYRKAFVGNMQQKLDEVHKRDTLRYYAENIKSCSSQPLIIYRNIDKPKPISVFAKIKEWIRKPLKKIDNSIESKELQGMFDDYEKTKN